MPIYGKNPLKFFFSETNRLISTKLGVKHRRLKYSNVYINHDHVMTLTKFMARSTWVAYAFEWGKLLKYHLKGNWQMDRILIILKKRKWPNGFICPCTGVKYHNIQTCLLVYAADLRCAFYNWSSALVIVMYTRIIGLFFHLIFTTFHFFLGPLFQGWKDHFMSLDKM